MHLELGWTGLDDESVATLVALPHLATLEHLSLRGTTLGEPALRAIAASPYLSRLTHLDLRQCHLPSRKGKPILLESPHLSDAVKSLIKKQKWR